MVKYKTELKAQIVHEYLSTAQSANGFKWEIPYWEPSNI